MMPQDHILLGGNLPNIACLDVWRKLQIQVHDVQDDELFSQAHSIEAVPPSIVFPYGHCHCVLVQWDEDAEETGIGGESLY
jgi:hypothetical protein